MEQQLVSVIVAVYNVEKYLDRCIESLVMQTYPHLEIILVDDGSTDRSGEICDLWANKDNRIIVIHKKNGGLSDARNKGIQKARGKWLGFVDGDDYVSATMYEHLYHNRIEQGITVCGYQTEKNGMIQSYPAINKIVQPREAVDLYMTNEIQAFCHGKFTYWGSYAWNKLYDSNLFTHVLYPVGKKYEDIYILFELLHQSVSVQFIPDCEYVYVQRSGSITQDSINIVHESLQARLCQKDQLFKYWKITDSRIENLVASEYFFILYRYACLSSKKRNKFQKIAEETWKKLEKMDYGFFPMKMRVKLFFFVHCPSLFYLLRKWILKAEG